MLDAMKASRIDLPLCAPIYSVSHGQGSVTSILHDNISLRNWYLNNSMVLSVRDGNPGGLFRPNIDICQSGPEDNPYIERQEILLTFLDGAVCRVIKNMINKGYYVYFGAIDDYYMKGRSGYHKRHYLHDGLICGYDTVNKSYSIYAYDTDMKYRVFDMPQSCFERARKSSERMGFCGSLMAMKPMKMKIELDPYLIKNRIIEYLDPPLVKNNLEENETAYGIIAHKYLIKYIDVLYNCDSDAVNLNLQAFKMIIEHKLFMLERIKKVEEYFDINDSISTAYSEASDKAIQLWNLCLYSVIKSDKSKIPVMKSILERIDMLESNLLSRLISLY